MSSRVFACSLALLAMSSCAAPPGELDEGEVAELGSPVKATACHVLEGTDARICSGTSDVWTAQVRVGASSSRIGEAAQTFVPAVDGEPVSVRLTLRRLRGIAAEDDALFTVGLRALNPDGSLPLSGDFAVASMRVADIAQGRAQVHELDFVQLDAEAPVELENGKGYALVFSAEPAENGDSYVGVASHVSGGEASGEAWWRGFVPGQGGSKSFAALGTGVSFSLLARTCDAGLSEATAVASCEAVAACGLTTSGERWLKPTSGAAFPVWCDFDTAGGPWIDLVKTMRASGSTFTAQLQRFFRPASQANNPDGTAALSGANGVGASSGVEGFSIQAGYATDLYTLGVMFEPWRAGFSQSKVSISYRVQGANDGNRCGQTFWVPLSGPGWAGNYSGYAPSCRPGYACLFGSATNGRDEPIAVDYSNASLTNANLLGWSVWIYSSLSIDASSCTRDPEIPTSEPAVWFSRFLFR